MREMRRAEWGMEGGRVVVAGWGTVKEPGMSMSSS